VDSFSGLGFFRLDEDVVAFLAVLSSAPPIPASDETHVAPELRERGKGPASPNAWGKKSRNSARSSGASLKRA
jgi:hypothetical protein